MKPDLDAIRARWPDSRLANTDARADVLTLLAYIDELECITQRITRESYEWERDFISCNRARMHCERENESLRARIAELEAMKP